MDFKELDDTTRKCMLEEFKKEETNGKPYRSPLLTAKGLEQFPILMEKAITQQDGNEVTLAKDLNNSSYWVPTTVSHRKGIPYTKTVNPDPASKRLAITEFNTWYVKGLAKKLIDEGITECEIYRAESADQPRCECTRWEGKKISVKEVYDGHRIRYHHEKIDSTALQIPSGAYCHHAIKRIDQ